MRNTVPTNCWRGVPLPTYLTRSVSALCKVRRSVLIPHHLLTQLRRARSLKNHHSSVLLSICSQVISRTAPRCLGFILATAKAGSSLLVYLVALLRSAHFAGPTTHSFGLRIPLLDMNITTAQSLGYISISWFDVLTICAPCACTIRLDFYHSFISTFPHVRKSISGPDRFRLN